MIGTFLGHLVLVSVIVSILVVLALVPAGHRWGLSAFLTGLIGILACFVLAYVSFYLLDPDPVSEFDAPVPLYQRTLTVTGFSALFWLPLFLNLFTRMRRRLGAA